MTILQSNGRQVGKEERTERQKNEYLENENSFLLFWWNKNIFHSFWRAIIWWKNKNLMKIADTSFKDDHPTKSQKRSTNSVDIFIIGHNVKWINFYHKKKGFVLTIFWFLCFWWIHKLWNLWRHHRRYYTLLYFRLFLWNLTYHGHFYDKLFYLFLRF